MPDALAALAQALGKGLDPGFAERAATSAQLAELVLDAVEAALPLTDGREAGPALEQLELLATGIDVFSWDGVPGWDEVLARGLGAAAPAGLGSAGPRDGLHALDALDGLGQPARREDQRALLEARARALAAQLLVLGRDAAQGARPALLVALHAALLRLFALAAVAPLCALDEAPATGAARDAAPPLAGAGAQALQRELDARAAAGSDFATAQDEWLARLSSQHPEAAAHPAFHTFFAGLAPLLRTCLALRRFAERAAAGAPGDAPPGDAAAILGAVGGWQPVRWSALRQGVSAEWLAALFPPAPPGELPGHAHLARQCGAALDAAGHLWFARGLSAGQLAALATALVARSAAVFASWEELGGTGRAR